MDYPSFYTSFWGAICSILTWRRGRIDQAGCTPRARLAIALRLAESCDSLKRRELGRIIYGSGDLRSRYPLQHPNVKTNSFIDTKFLIVPCIFFIWYIAPFHQPTNTHTHAHTNTPKTKGTQKHVDRQTYVQTLWLMCNDFKRTLLSSLIFIQDMTQALTFHSYLINIYYYCDYKRYQW